MLKLTPLFTGDFIPKTIPVNFEALSKGPNYKTPQAIENYLIEIGNKFSLYKIQLGSICDETSLQVFISGKLEQVSQHIATLNEQRFHVGQPEFNWEPVGQAIAAIMAYDIAFESLMHENFPKKK